MSKSLNKFVKEISTNLEVGMDEVVNVFVTQYEDNLHDRKDFLQKQIKTVKKEFNDFNDDILNDVDKSLYQSENVLLGISTHVTNTTVVWNKTEEYKYKKIANLPQSLIDISVNVMDTSNKSLSFTKSFYVSISVSNINKHNDIKSKLSDLNTELVDILVQIKSISRKERQIRGNISKMKLEQSCYDGLLEDWNLQKLIKINDK